MFLAKNPEKGRTEEEQAETKSKYTPGENVLPKVEEREQTLRERRVDDADRRLMNEVRGLSLQEVGVETPEARRERRRTEEERRLRAPRSRDASRDSRNTEERDRERRRRREEHALRQARDEAAALAGDEERRRPRHEERTRSDEADRAVRQIEHQSSLRSLISSSDVDSREMEEEILRQIREEGLLDGIDLENIDVSQEDQISERIAEAFRRRQSERARQEPARRSDASRRRRTAPSSTPASRETSEDEAVRPSSRRRRTHSRTASGHSATTEPSQPSRPPQSMSAVQAAHLEIQSSDEGRHRRRRSSSRSATDPIRPAPSEAPPATRSQTDLSDRPSSVHAQASRPLVTTESRSTTDPSLSRANEHPSPEQRPRQLRQSPNTSPRASQTARMEEVPAGRERKPPAGPPADILVPPAASSLVASGLSPRSPRDLSRTISLSDRAGALSSGSRPTSSSSAASRNRAQLYKEPLLKCARCFKPHIEYELHYNCGICNGGNYDICLSCYRSSKGCLHWFGFGQAAWTRWEVMKQAGETNVEKPHMLTACRYLPPKSQAGGAEGRKTLTTDDPQKRLQSGMFCANCLSWANECYWRCDLCNEGDWGFCNTCVNQGKSCTHSLLPLKYEPLETANPPVSPTHDHQTPAAASILTGPGVMDIGPFKPLTFSTKCDICRYPIQPSQTRYHCFACTSKVANTLPGDYDVCTTCYPKLIASRRMSAENGPSGWRRCLQGHRMVVVGFEDNRGGQRRILVQELVGGRDLREKPCTTGPHAAENLHIWSWGDGCNVRGDNTHHKLVTTDVMKSAPTTSPNLVLDAHFPPDGGVGMIVVATWSWYPAEGADDELLFPKGAEVREVKDVNGDWFHGCYMGKGGLFPSNFVRILDRGIGG